MKKENRIFLECLWRRWAQRVIAECFEREGASRGAAARIARELKVTDASMSKYRNTGEMSPAMLVGIMINYGMQVIDLPPLPDDIESLEACLREALQKTAELLTVSSIAPLTREEFVALRQLVKRGFLGADDNRRKEIAGRVGGLRDADRLFELGTRYAEACLQVSAELPTNVVTIVNNAMQGAER